jgi:hypothetical protein
MKVVRITDEDTKLTKKQRQQVAILKLIDNGKYVENVGIKDNEFYLLVETEQDDVYLEFKTTGIRPKPARKSNGEIDESLVRMVMILMTEDEINKKKALLKNHVGKEWGKW